MTLQQVWETLKEAIVAYTPATFFALVPLLVAAYHVLAGLFEPSDARHRPRSFKEMQPPPPLVQVGETTEEELKQSDGSDPKTPLVISRDSSARSSSPLTRSCPYDVFLSFRGVDTRNNFTGHLYTSLVQKGINTFIDDEELRQGNEISSSLLKAIHGSKISIIIFSENYASSKWCLDELVEILKCKELKQQLVCPVFYKVEPTVVRHQTGRYGEALAQHECRFKDNMDKVQRWRTALREAATLKGWTFSDGHEAKFINDIAEKISAQVAKRCYLNVAKYPVGIESRVQDMLKRLDVWGSGVRVVGIWGIGGIGKSTIAKAVYNSIRHMFEGSCFLANVRAASIPYQGLVQLQNDLLHGILGGWKMEMTDADRGIEVIKGRLGSKRVLIVLDDVNELNQLDKLAGGSDWFGHGSRIIITTRDKRLLISHQINAIYRAKALNDDEARNLLILTAFKEKRNTDECVKFPIGDAVRFARGLPLALDILGSHLCGSSIHQWHATIDYFSSFPNRDIQKVLETSYHALEYPMKEAFLDIACFFNCKEKDYVMQALDSSYLNPRLALEVLEEKALINIDQYGRIRMHDLLEEMGKEIVRKESPDDAGRRSRLWFHEDVCRVLTEDTGSSKVKGIIVALPREDEICLSAKCFKKMKNLQLFININARFSGEVYYLPNQLRFLDWPGFPAQCLPSDFNPQKLVKLSMPNSRISRLGQGLENLQNLKSLSFGSCKLLTEVPDLSGRIPYLERLDLTDCANLAELHPSVGFLDKLVHFDLNGCCNLKTFPKMVNMKSLQDINLRGCERLENIPEFVGRFPYLERLDLTDCANLAELHPSVGFLDKLVDFKLEGCCNLETFPRIVNMKSLYTISFSGCKRLKNIPEFVGRMKSLWEMDVSGTAITEVPSSIGYHLCNLQVLILDNCENLTTLPFSINKMRWLINLYLTGCPKLKLPPVPNKVKYSEASKSNISHHGKQISSENDDDQVNFGFPFLTNLRKRRCSISESGFLETLGGAPSLDMLDLSYSNFVSLPTGLTKFINLMYLDLNGCKMLQEVTELPPNLTELYIRNCVSLERISKLSSILKRQESQMFGWLDLRNCWRLRDNLVREAEMNGLLGNDDPQVETDLFSLFLSSQKSAFGVVLPGIMPEVSKWFSCPMDYKENGVCEFHIQVLANFQWENTGVALCIVSENMPELEIKCFFNEVLVMKDRLCGLLRFGFDNESDFELLRYIPFDGIGMQAFGYTRPVPPFQCRVIIHQSSIIYQRSYTKKKTPMRSCGVHLVMPPNEACMKLSQVLCRTDTMEAEDENVDEVEVFMNRYREDGPSELKPPFFITDDVSSDELESSDGDELESSDGCADELEASDV